MRWAFVTGVGLGALGAGGLAGWLALQAIPLYMQLGDPTGAALPACARGRVAECAQERQAMEGRAQALAVASLGCVAITLLLGAVGTRSLLELRAEEEDDDEPPPPGAWREPGRR